MIQLCQAILVDFRNLISVSLQEGHILIQSTYLFTTAAYISNQSLFIHAMDRYETVKLLGQGGEGAALLVKRKEDQQLFVCKKKTYISIDEANQGLQEVSIKRIYSISADRTVTLVFIPGYFLGPIQQRICYALRRPVPADTTRGRYGG